MRRHWKFLFLLLLPGCAVTGQEALSRIPGLAGATQVYTLTNLHADDPRPLLWTGNYQRAGLIPVCSAVRIESLRRDRMVFVVEATGRRYRYGNKPEVASFPAHLSNYFGRECPRALIDSLGDIDRRNIEAGTVEPGMTKQGVVLSLGYPPPKATPSLDAPKWRYWRNRYATFFVEFDDKGRVTKSGYPR